MNCLLITLFVLITSDDLTRGNPHLDLVPKPSDSGSEGALIWYRRNDEQSVKKWTDQLDKFFSKYEKYQALEKFQDCANSTKSEVNKSCRFMLSQIPSPCTSSNRYNFWKGTPCLFLQLNTDGWVPELYKHSLELPNNAPQAIKDVFKRKGSVEEVVLLHCDGNTAADMENIGPIDYYPERGFHQNFLLDNRPLVAIHFRRPIQGVLINVNCTIWAKNINRTNNQGSITLELLID